MTHMIITFTLLRECTEAHLSKHTLSPIRLGMAQQKRPRSAPSKALSALEDERHEESHFTDNVFILK